MRGGPRPGAGRKQKSELITARDLIHEAISARQWLALVKKLHAAACEGNIRAIELLFRYNYGSPEKVEPPSHTLPPLSFIEIPPIPPGGWPAGTELATVKHATEADLNRFAKIEEMHRLKAEIEQDYIEK